MQEKELESPNNNTTHINSEPTERVGSQDKTKLPTTNTQLPLEQIKEILKAKDIEDISPDEVLSISKQLDFKNYKKIVQTFQYYIQRNIRGISRVEAFEIAFPERCVRRDDTDRGRFDSSTGSKDLAKITIDLKAKRIEQTKVYKAIYSLVNTSFYITYAVERMEVLNKAYNKIMNEKTSDRDRASFMKIFLEETRKNIDADVTPEVNINMNSQTVNIVEQKMEDIAKRLQGLPASEVINILGNKNGSKNS